MSRRISSFIPLVKSRHLRDLIQFLVLYFSDCAEFIEESLKKGNVLVFRILNKSNPFSQFNQSNTIQVLVRSLLLEIKYDAKYLLLPENMHVCSITSTISLQTRKNKFYMFLDKSLQQQKPFSSLRKKLVIMGTQNTTFVFAKYLSEMIARCRKQDVICSKCMRIMLVLRSEKHFFLWQQYILNIPLLLKKALPQFNAHRAENVLEMQTAYNLSSNTFSPNKNATNHLLWFCVAWGFF